LAKNIIKAKQLTQRMFNKVQYQRSWKQYTRNAIRDTRKKHYAENEKHEQVI